MTLISNEYRTCSMSDPAIATAANEAKGYDKDPADLLEEFEDRADQAWRSESSAGPRQAYVDRYVSESIANL